ncbi:putative beta-lysine N-acetyltransferase [Bacillus sp. JJ1609]|uniref:putative beta-lysine N-acetyltransferase n=1 Tax=Bacillus sp. JJ1609 TaxID=3122977 RepID=UPI002FFF5042
MHPGKTLEVNEKTYKMKVYLDKQNRRIRVDDYLGNLLSILEKAEKIAVNEKADKMIIKGRKEHFIQLLESGYRFEASIDGYFLGSDCFFFSKFLTDERKISTHWTEEDGIIKSVYHLKEPSQSIAPPIAYILKKMGESDATGLSKLYKSVFQIYPTPLDNPDYIVKTMQEGTVYYGFINDGQVVSAASAEVNIFYKNAELTDCATLKEHRKHGLMKILLERIEQELVENGIYCAYSIARALSFGMNAVLYQLGYAYRGRLVNNVFIYDKIENMNVWVKDLVSPPNFRQ